MGREEGSGWGTHVYLWRIHFDIWQNQYNIVKFKNKIKLKKKFVIKFFQNLKLRYNLHIIRCTDFEISFISFNNCLHPPSIKTV